MSYYTEPSVFCNRAGFDPYEMNGGSIIAIAGQDYAIIGSDTRLSTYFSIFTRNQKKLFKLSDATVLGVSGCWGDALTLSKILEARLQMYKHEHGKTMSTPAVAQMLSTMLYYKRFFPYYVANILTGLDEHGIGCVFCYDPVGHVERCMFRAGGTAGSLLQPLLDNQIGFNNMQIDNAPIDLKKATAILKDGFISASERDIYTGDCIQIMTITAKGICCETFELRKD